jgi:opacity protein-like surface antigen
MATDLNHWGWARGNLEALGEAHGGAIFEGKGNYVSGLSIYGRYNLVPQGWRVSPYAQIGLGLTLTDVDRHLEGENFNFNIDFGLGLRYLMSKHWSLNLECRFQHISNADLSNHNLGVNGIGPMLGVSYLFN